MTGKPINTEIECGNCGRTVTEVNLNPQLATCLFCDLNEDVHDNEN